MATAPTPVLTECRYGGWVDSGDHRCGERGSLCDECKEDRADARAVARMAQEAVSVWTMKMDRKDMEATTPGLVIDFYEKAAALAANGLRLAREAVKR